MRIVFNIDVGVDVPSYVQAGEILDRITREVEAAIGAKGSYDVGNFRANHRPVNTYPEPQPMMAMDTAEEARG